ncbi:GNAT family N-acetyltransferase [Paractinoplanes ferrugineus]|uniref:GNAT family N-acetyltransferase n=1 Tax=Paractinoplanes ferrugineus TaxID=113564 RepID=A0A919J222_9ACTN|nr:GNAT family N-acetyltransferase [Actinoplanes ferrugineus]GIE11004.1 GNAT family N-acetyltransferase [Actinoplanes ferrugineus]
MISIAPQSSAADPELRTGVADLVNKVYAVAEDGLWAGEVDRTSPAEIGALIDAGELVVARDGAEIIGAARVQRLPSGEGEVGMLVTHPARRGAGLGGDLLAYAEDWARGQGRHTMQLELLVPKTWSHPVKEFLRGWYTRSGYRVVRVTDLAESFPALAPRLATPCDFLIFNKPL